MKKMFIVAFFALLVLSALIIREKEGGFLAYKDGNYPLALEKLKKESKHGDPLATYFVGRIYYDPQSKLKDYEEAAIWFLKSAELGYIDGAVMYLYVRQLSKTLKVNCHTYENLLKLAASTGNIMSAVFVGDALARGLCNAKNLPMAAFYYHWAGDRQKNVGTKFHNLKRKMSNNEISIFENIKNRYPLAVSEQEFFSQFFGELKKQHLVSGKT